MDRGFLVPWLLWKRDEIVMEVNAEEQNPVEREHGFERRRCCGAGITFGIVQKQEAGQQE